jgi:Pyruvate/2-oxoacid:ferredoxin oxidoreductase delta subunit
MTPNAAASHHYLAIEMQEIRIELTLPPPEGMFSEVALGAMSRIRVPVVKADACVGCGICQCRCPARNVLQEGSLQQSAIIVRAENEHRFLSVPTDPQGVSPALS